MLVKFVLNEFVLTKDLVYKKFALIVSSIHPIICKKSRGSSPFANFISANFLTAIFQNVPKIFNLYKFWAIDLISASFWAKIAEKFAIMR